MVLILIQCYWIFSSIGLLDLDLPDLDLDGVEGSGALHSLAVLINIGEVPFAVVISLMSLNLWVLSMLMFYIPVEPGGLISGLLLIPFFYASAYLAKVEILPLKRIFVKGKDLEDLNHKVMQKRCILKCDLDPGKLGQAELSQGDTSIVINVKAEFPEETFLKDDYALVYRKDKKQDVYYIAKLLLENETYRELEELK